MCPNCRAFITTRDRVCPYCDTEVGPRAIERRPSPSALSSFVPHAHFTTSIILLINFGLYAATALYSARAGDGGWTGIDGQTLFAFGAKFRDAIFAGQWWRLIVAGFLHGGMLHIFMNSWILFDLGAQVEEIYGNSRMLVIYFLATVCGFLASTFWSPNLSVGASAGLFGLIGAMIALTVRYPTSVASAMRGLYVRWVLYMLVIGLLPGLRIDTAAHIGGLAAGFGCGYFAGLPSLVNTARERLWRIAAYMALALTAFSFVQMFLWFRFYTA